jgi:sugar lactone lactonase YvrE
MALVLALSAGSCGEEAPDGGAPPGRDLHWTGSGHDGGPVGGPPDGGPGDDAPAGSRDGGPGPGDDGGGIISRLPNPIPAENALPGDDGWRLTKPAASREIEGYARQTSVTAGESVEVAVSVQPSAAHFSYRVYRLGDYGGTGGRRRIDGPTLQATPRAIPEPDAATGLIDPRWPVSFSVSVADDWLSGPYVIVLQRDDGYQSYVPFIVHDDRQAALYLVHAVTTSQAYNRWGGTSLYANDTTSGIYTRPRAFAVTFDRPYQSGYGAGQILDNEVPLARWLEKNGYDVTYGTSHDLLHSDVRTHGRAYLSVGHDEYWSVEMRDAVEKAKAQGVHLAFFSANTSYWRIRLAPSSDGRPERVQISYKDDATSLDPVAATDPTAVTGLWRGPAGRPENGLIGVMYDAWQILTLPMVVHADASHWLFAGTGLDRFDVIPNTIGCESDRTWDNGSTPAGTTILMRSPVISHWTTVTKQESTIYQAPAGGWVFGGGSIEWVHGVTGGYADARLIRLLANLLRAFGAGDPSQPLPPASRPPPVPQPAGVTVETWAGTGRDAHVDGPGVTAQFISPAGIALRGDGSVVVADVAGLTVRLVGSDAEHTVSTLAGDGTVGEEDGPGSTARFGAPTSVAVDAAGNIYVVDGALYTIRRIANDAAHTVTTLAGTRWNAGSVDGPGASALFSTPSGIALGPDGALYIAEIDGSRIRRMETTSPYRVSTIAGQAGAGYVDGPGTQARFGYPSGIAAGPDGVLYVLDTQNCAVRRIGTDAARTVSTLFQDPGCGGGPTGFTGQLGIAVDVARDRLVLTDTAQYRIVTLPLAGGAISLLSGDGRYKLDGPDGPSFAVPLGVAMTPVGDVIVADTGHFKIRLIHPD